MRRNPARRATLVDAAIEVLADDGARGLTFRAVDTRAAVPAGTASNYFANRDDLLNQVGSHIHRRFGPDESELTELTHTPASREETITQLQGVTRRISTDRTRYLALLELRLEATRRPALRDALTRTVRVNFERDVRYHEESDAPGDRRGLVLLYLAVSGLLVEELTLPEVLDQHAPDELVAELVARIIPPE